MTDQVRNVLYKPRWIKRRIGCKRAKIDALKARVETRGINYDKLAVQTSPSDVMADTIAEIADLERECDELCKQYDESLKAVEDAVSLLDDETEYTILYMIYVGHKPFTDVAEAVSYSYRHAHRIMRNAIQHLDEKMSHMSQIDSV